MRCIALGQSWKAAAGDVTIVSACDNEALKNRILSEGFYLVAVEEPHPHPSDLGLVLELLDAVDPKWLVLDGYNFDAAYQEAIRKSGKQLLVIDDMNHLPEYHADILLNQNIHGPSLNYRCNAETVKLFGTRFVLLRREFREAALQKDPAPENVKKVLVTLGGGDPDNITGKVLSALRAVDDRQLEIKVVVGPVNPHRDALQETSSALSSQVEMLTNTFEMPALMRWADVAISAAGSTCWELAYAGVPALLVVVADNQRLLAEHLDAEGVAVNLGWHSALTPAVIGQSFVKFLDQSQPRRGAVLRGQALVDGCGSLRVVDRMRGRR